MVSEDIPDSVDREQVTIRTIELSDELEQWLDTQPVLNQLGDSVE